MLASRARPNARVLAQNGRKADVNRQRSIPGIQWKMLRQGIGPRLYGHLSLLAALPHGWRFGLPSDWREALLDQAGSKDSKKIIHQDANCRCSILNC